MSLTFFAARSGAPNLRGVVFFAAKLQKTPHEKNDLEYCVSQVPLSEAVNPLASYACPGKAARAGRLLANAKATKNGV